MSILNRIFPISQYNMPKCITEIDNMNGYEFEQFTGALLKNLGYKNIVITKKSNDYGIDLTCSKNGKKYAIQCKCYSYKLGNAPIQEAVAGRQYYECDIGVVITNNYFTENAINLADVNGILLWDRNELINMLQKVNKIEMQTTVPKTIEKQYYNDDNSIELENNTYKFPNIEMFDSCSNKYKNAVKIYDLLDTFEFMSSKFSVCLGIDDDSNPIYCNLLKMPHLLISGNTGSGKSICMHSIIASILFKAQPTEVKFMMIDPKKVELLSYSNIPHLIIPVVTDTQKANSALGWIISELSSRYQKFTDLGCRDIDGYNEHIKNHSELEIMPRILICIDGLEVLMLENQTEIENSICHIAQIARAAGIHLIISTQRKEIIKKANIDASIETIVINSADNDETSEHFLLLYNPPNKAQPIRITGCLVIDEDIRRLCNFLKNQNECIYAYDILTSTIKDSTKMYNFPNSYNEVNLHDPLFNNAVDVILENGIASTSFLQRKLGVGYSRGSTIMDQLEECGIIGPQIGANPRKILINQQQWLKMKNIGK